MQFDPLDSGVQNNPPMFTPSAADYARKLAPWAKFLSVLMYIGAAFCVLGGIMMLAMGSSFSNTPGLENNPLGGAFMGLFVLFYFAIAAVYVFVAKWTWDFQSNSLAAAQLNSPERLELAYKNMYRIFLLFGIFALLIIVLYVVMIGIIGVGAASL